VCKTTQDPLLLHVNGVFAAREVSSQSASRNYEANLYTTVLASLGISNTNK